MGNDRRFRWIICLAAGLVAGLALPPQGWPWLLWPALVPLWALAGRRRFAPLGAGLWGLGAVLVSHRWLLWLHPLTWIGVPAPLSLPVCVAIWLVCGLTAGLLVMAWVELIRRLDASRPSTALIGAVLWGLAEVGMARGPLFWLGLGSAALPGDRPWAGLAAVGGVGLIATLQLGIGWCLWRGLRAVQGRRRWLALAVLLVLAGHGLGAAALAASRGGDGQGERLLVLQTAIPTRRKFEAIEQGRLLRQLASAQRVGGPAQMGSDAVASPESPASLVLPEGSLPVGQPLPEPAGLEVLSGGFRLQGEETRSSLLRFAPGDRLATSWVDKHRLVPLGEWVPMARLWRWGGLSAVGGIEPGAPSRLLRRPAGAIGVAICYELSDGAALADATRQGATWLLASANLDPYPPLLQSQFLALARLRAIETGRWLVSSANTGPSLVVDARGDVQARLPAAVPTSAVMTVRHRDRLTPYGRWGELPLLLLLAAASLVRAFGRCGGRPPQVPLALE